MVRCMLFMKNPEKAHGKEGLGAHPFARVPCVGEYLTLSPEGPHVRVTHVHHTAFGTHVAELYVEQFDLAELQRLWARR